MIIISHFHNGHASWPNPCLISLWSFTNSNEMTQTSAFVSVLARCDYVLKFNHNKLGRDLQNKSSVTDLYSVTHLFRMPPLSDVNTGAVMWVFNAVIDSTSSRIEALHNLLYANMSAYTPTESHSKVCLFQHIEAVLCFFFFLNTVVQSQCFYASSSMWNVTDVLGIISHLAALMTFCVIWLQTSLNIEKLFTKFSLPTTRPCAQQFNSHPNRADATCHTCHGFNSCATTLATRVSQERHFVTRCTTT